jgi:hypothetical protein
MSGSFVKPRNWHYGLSLILCAALLPALHSQNLPVRFDWIRLSVAYWIFLAAQSVFVAALLCVIGVPGVWRPLLARYRKEPVRAVALLIYFGLLLWALGGMKALVVTVDTIAVIDWRERYRERGLSRAAGAVLPAAAYLFFGFLMILAYNSVIVSARYNFAYDPALAVIDHRLMLGYSVPELAHWAVRTFPLSFFRGLEFIYFGMFPQIGAAIVWLSLSGGRTRSLQFVGTILLSYYIALALFYLWPAQGPYVLCLEHFSEFPAGLQAYTIQKTLIAHALALWQHQPIQRISTDYFIGLPCMHIAQPLIVLWFLRRWKRVAWMLAGYDVLLAAAVLLLEWHYVADMIAGVLVAGAAIVISGAAAANGGQIPHFSRQERARNGAPGTAVTHGIS